MGMRGALTAVEQGTNAYTYDIVDRVDEVVERMCEATTRTPQVAVVTITLRFDAEGRSHSGRIAQAKRSVRYFLDTLRTLVRKTDIVCLHQSTYYFILLGANQEGGKIVQERLWEALLWRIHNATGGEIARPRSVTIGHSAATAPNGDVRHCLREALKPSHAFDLYPERIVQKETEQPDEEPDVSSSGEDLSMQARKLGIPYLALLPRKLPARVQQLVSPQLAQELRCYPLGRERDKLTVAICDPQDQYALERLHQVTGLHIFPVLVPAGELQSAIEGLG